MNHYRLMLPDEACRPLLCQDRYILTDPFIQPISWVDRRLGPTCHSASVEAASFKTERVEPPIPGSFCGVSVRSHACLSARASARILLSDRCAEANYYVRDVRVMHHRPVARVHTNADAPRRHRPGWCLPRHSPGPHASLLVLFGEPSPSLPCCKFFPK